MKPPDLTRLIFRVCGWTLLLVGVLHALARSQFPFLGLTVGGERLIWSYCLWFVVLALCAQEFLFRMIRWMGTRIGGSSLRVSCVAFSAAVLFTFCSANIDSIHASAPWLGLIPVLPWTLFLILCPGVPLIRGSGTRHTFGPRDGDAQDLIPWPDVASILWRIAALNLVLAPAGPLWHMYQTAQTGAFNGLGKNSVAGLSELSGLAVPPAAGLVLLGFERMWLPFLLGTREPVSSGPGKMVSLGAGLFLLFYAVVSTGNATVSTAILYLEIRSISPKLVASGGVLRILLTPIAFDFAELLATLLLAIGLLYWARRSDRSSGTTLGPAAGP